MAFAMKTSPVSRHREINTEKYSALTSFNGRYRPLMLVIETINICNNDCIICTYGDQTRLRRTMEDAVFEKVIDDYAAMGGGCVSLTPVVGEAFLDKKLVGRIRYMRQYPEITGLSVTTNAVMTYRLDESDLRYVLRNFNQVHISVYGIDEEEYFVQTQKRTYDKMVEGIRRILNHATGNVVIGFRFLKDRSVDDMHRWISEVRAGTAYEGEIGLNWTRDYANWSVKDTSSLLPFGARWKPTPVNTRQCAVPFYAAQIMVNGSVSFCSCPNFDDDKQLSLGNVKDASLLDILNNDASYKLWNWDEFGVPDFCRSCSFHAPIDAIPRMEWAYTDPIRQIVG